MKNIENNKSPGPGGIPVELYKYTPEVVIETLTTIFNKYLKWKPIPTEWKVAYIRSLYKNANKKDCSNNRCLNATAARVRLYERVLSDRIEKKMQETEEHILCEKVIGKDTRIKTYKVELE